MQRRKLDESEIRAQLARVPLWSLVSDRLRREWRFADFSEAFAFMARVALLAEKLDHHPDWSNSYARVTVEFTTHDAGGLSALDFELAARIDAVCGR